MAKIQSEMDKAIQSCGGHLGDLISWHISVGTAGVTPEDFATIAKEAGVADDLLPKVRPAEAAARRAVRECARRAPGLRAEIISESDGYLVWGITAHDVTEETSLGDATAQLVNRIAFVRVDLPDQDLSRGDLVADVADDPILDAIKLRYESYRGNFTHPELLAFIMRSLRSFFAVPMPGQGHYFVPPAFAEQVRALRDTIEKCGASEFGLLPLPKVPEAQSVIADAAMVAIGERMDKLRGELEKWRDGDGPRTDTIARRLIKAGELQDQMKGLFKLTASTSKTLKGEMAQLVSDIKGLVVTADEQPDEPPVAQPEPDAQPEPEVKAMPTPPAAPAPPAAPVKPTNSEDDPQGWSTKKLRRRLKDLGHSYRGLKKPAMVAIARANQ